MLSDLKMFTTLLFVIVILIQASLMTNEIQYPFNVLTAILS